MRKIKKSLAVLLAVLMLASFMPLFASAEAITINRNNVKIVPPSVSPSVIEYGQTLADITVTGGECWYVDPDTGVETLVPGHFEVRSTTTKPAVNDAYNVQLKFVSDDTTQYSNISLLTATTVTIKSGTWPTLKVNGLDGVLVEAPTAADILTGQKLREATLTGGVVNDKDGNALTGTWSFVDTNFYPTASGKYEVQFKATGYNTLKTTVDNSTGKYNGGFTVVYGVYDEYGNMTDVIYSPVSSVAAQKDTVVNTQAITLADKDNSFVKVFIWNGNLKPLNKLVTFPN